MKISSLFIRTAAIALLAIPFSSHAESWSCTKDTSVREIHIQTESPSSPVPCSVVYKKITEGAADQILWSAENDAAYCEEKAKAFVEKQTFWGWTCVEKAGGESTETKPGN